MCPVPVSKCGRTEVDLNYNSPLASMEVRGLNQGEVCNYRAKAACGAPAFKAVPGGTYSSSLSHFNITYVESEDDSVCKDTPGWVNSEQWKTTCADYETRGHCANGKATSADVAEHIKMSEWNTPADNCCACGKDKDVSNTPILNTKFIYQMYNINAMDVMEQSYNMDSVKNAPRKGIYSNDDMGFKTFNNGQQSSYGGNGYKEMEEDGNCKDRYLFVSVTALEDKSNVDLGF